MGEIIPSASLSRVTYTGNAFSETKLYTDSQKRKKKAALKSPEKIKKNESVRKNRTIKRSVLKRRSKKKSH